MSLAMPYGKEMDAWEIDLCETIVNSFNLSKTLYEVIEDLELDPDSFEDCEKNRTNYILFASSQLGERERYLFNVANSSVSIMN